MKHLLNLIVRTQLIKHFFTEFTVFKLAASGGFDCFDCFGIWNERFEREYLFGGQRTPFYVARCIHPFSNLLNTCFSFRYCLNAVSASSSLALNL